jgi:SAM-dependent methyltransferase
MASHEPGPGSAYLRLSYDEFPRVEEEFDAALRESLRPRGPDLLYDIVRGMGLPAGAVAVDVGCGEGRHAVRLAELGLAVVGVDPVPRQVEVATDRLASLDPSVRGRTRFEVGTAEELPLADGSADLVWCRDVMVHVADLPRAYAEFARVLRGGGRAVVYQMLAGPRLEPREAAWLWRTLGVVPTSADPERVDAAVATSGLRVDERIDLGTEWGEWAEEQNGRPARALLHVARLLRDPQRYVARFGQEAYDLMLGDCLWQVYAMIGKLQRRVYVLSRR